MHFQAQVSSISTQLPSIREMERKVERGIEERERRYIEDIYNREGERDSLGWVVFTLPGKGIIHIHTVT